MWSRLQHWRVHQGIRAGTTEPQPAWPPTKNSLQTLAECGPSRGLRAGNSPLTHPQTGDKKEARLSRKLKSRIYSGIQLGAESRGNWNQYGFATQYICSEGLKGGKRDRISDLLLALRLCISQVILPEKLQCTCKHKHHRTDRNLL